ncbi:hypothetical protein EIN_116320 [Entamoeba invadens IP1]|uniref:Uncharacterized protein n=1 Tax=Entamoeba invadens IP1 TaxID=370355 RepID=L7FNP7_ENTIV|nr:hypothetical protein EIN_116320 [Entamoeba invadens IP1]ELP94531.1 hypothetical protein EIN_116320 [Entamoeba invadens IP1]|eukprot:XP_004261302.1 hypothetical protein EIN_116320 [Entamoeba invadens IP1]
MNRLLNRAKLYYKKITTSLGESQECKVYKKLTYFTEKILYKELRDMYNIRPVLDECAVVEKQRQKYKKLWGRLVKNMNQIDLYLRRYLETYNEVAGRLKKFQFDEIQNNLLNIQRLNHELRFNDAFSNLGFDHLSCICEDMNPRDLDVGIQLLRVRLSLASETIKAISSAFPLVFISKCFKNLETAEVVQKAEYILSDLYKLGEEYDAIKRKSRHPEFDDKRIKRNFNDVQRCQCISTSIGLLLLNIKRYNQKFLSDIALIFLFLYSTKVRPSAKYFVREVASFNKEEAEKRNLKYVGEKGAVGFWYLFQERMEEEFLYILKKFLIKMDCKKDEEKNSENRKIENFELSDSLTDFFKNFLKNFSSVKDEEEIVFKNEKVFFEIDNNYFTKEDEMGYWEILKKVDFEKEAKMSKEETEAYNKLTRTKSEKLDKAGQRPELNMTWNYNFDKMTYFNEYVNGLQDEENVEYSEISQMGGECVQCEEKDFGAQEFAGIEQKSAKEKEEEMTLHSTSTDNLQPKIEHSQTRQSDIQQSEYIQITTSSDIAKKLTSKSDMTKFSDEWDELFQYQPRTSQLKTLYFVPTISPRLLKVLRGEIPSVISQSDISNDVSVDNKSNEQMSKKQSESEVMQANKIEQQMTLTKTGNQKRKKKKKKTLMSIKSI